MLLHAGGCCGGTSIGGLNQIYYIIHFRTRNMLLVLPALWRYTRFENCEYFNGPFGFIYQIAPVT